jgi:hypothetical protein
MIVLVGSYSPQQNLLSLKSINGLVFVLDTQCFRVTK